MFIDTAKVRVQAGSGGNGCLSFRREKFIPRGGPNGGDGGRGGHIIFRTSTSLNTLTLFRYKPLLRADRGQDGMGKSMHGADGEDMVVHVPIGTIVRNAETGVVIADMSAEGMEAVVARGGKGGLGNERFKSSTNRAPRKTTDGRPGEEYELEIELRLLADVGLIGLPNAGKSTLISRISASRPKIADYPFTTIEPNLGVVDLGEYHSCVVADVPGLISGAHEGKGLGIRFLRHLSRCTVLLHLLDAVEEAHQAMENFDAIERELSLFSAALAKKPRAIVLTKLDVTEARAHSQELAARFRERGYEVLSISAVTGEGLDALRGLIAAHLGRAGSRERLSLEFSDEAEGVDR
ncbi:MAG: GTPase ObgE [bacterium]|nr:GTPase ObgE [bacterium]